MRIRTHLLLPVCDACGDMATTQAQARARALKAALEEAYAAKHRR